MSEIGRSTEAGLKRRGDLTLWIDEAAIAGWQAPRRTTPGGQARYSDLAIQLVLMLRLVFHLALRQAEAFAGSVLRLLGIDLFIPDHTTLSRRSRNFSGRRPHTVSHGPVHLVIDSTGLKLFGQGEWNEEKHGRARRSWRKLHLALDGETGEIVASVLTGNDLDDAGQTPVLLEQVDAEIASVTADGAYDGEPVYQAIASRQPDKPPDVIIPPRSSAARAHQPATLRVSATVTSAPLRRRAGWLGRRQPATAVVVLSRPRSADTKASSALACMPAHSQLSREKSQSFRRELFLLRKESEKSVRELRYLGSAPLPELEGETGSGSAGTIGRAIAALRSRLAIPTRRTST